MLSALALTYTATYLPPRALLAHVHAGSSFDTPPVYVASDPALDPGALARRAGLNPDEPFVVQWDGYLVVHEPGRYRLRLRSDDGVAVWVEERTVVDRLAASGPQLVIEAVSLERGLQRVRIRYVQLGGAADFGLSWATPLWREHYVPVLAIAETDPPPYWRRVRKATDFPSMIALALSTWLIAGLALGLCHVMARVAGGHLWKTLRWQDVAPFAALAAVLLFVNIDTGTLPWRGWVPDELNPKDIADAARMRLTGGWFHFYPAFHVGLLVAVTSPIFALAEAGWISFDDPAISVLLHALIRSVTVVMAILSLVCVALLANLADGARAHHDRPGLDRRRTLAPYVLLGAPVFVFYGQTANVDVPYIFWSALAALAFVRALSERTRASHMWLGALVAAAMTTKDQAYGFFPGVALVLLWAAWRDAPSDAAMPRRLWLTAVDRRIWAGLVTCLVLWALLLGLPWNPGGVRAHFALITGTGSEPFRMFAPSVGGFLDLVATTLRLAWLSAGPFASTAALAGLAVAAADPARFRNAIPLLVLPLSYMVALIGVVGYVYDRFLLGVVVVAAVFAAIGLEAALTRIRSTRLRTAVTAVCLALLLYPGVSLTLRIRSDSRLQVERWLERHAEDDPMVIGVGNRLYLPNLFPYRHQFHPRTETPALLEWQADVIVINEDWIERPGQPPNRPFLQALADGGYEEVYAVRGWPADPGLQYLLDGTLAIDPVLSNVRKASPPLSVWKKSSSDRVR